MTLAWNRRRTVLVAILASLTTLAFFFRLAPGYFVERGFPLDDSWIHLVYGRSLAREFSLAYNPGHPATGATSPLWALVLGLVHVVAGDAPVRTVKAVGFFLHVAAAVVFALALSRERGARMVHAFGVGLVAAHPDLVAAAVSGMEVPLAELACALVAFAAVRDEAARDSGRRTVAMGVAAALAFLARPELAVVGIALPWLVTKGSRVRAVAAPATGIAVSFSALAARNLLVSGRPLPSTFYAKAAIAGLHTRLAGFVGTLRVFESIVVVDATLIVAFGLYFAGRTLARRPGPEDESERLASATVVVGVLGAVISCILVEPIAPSVFYHQRYVLPFVSCVVLGLPIVVHAATRELFGARAPLAWGPLLGIAALSIALSIARRPGRLENDARNVDDVQVRIGRRLRRLPENSNAWVIDAGASRYFGSGFIVDLMGLNCPEILDGRRRAFLAAHPPSRIEVVDEWDVVEVRGSTPWPASRARASTQYTVTDRPAMATHTLLGCPEGGVARLTVRKTWSATIRCP